MNGLTWFWPSVAVALLASWTLAPAVARNLRTERWVALLFIFGIGLVVAATATPIRPPVGVDVEIQRACDLSRRWLATLPEMTSWSDVTLGIGVYIPVGMAIALLPISLHSAAAAVGAIALPAVIEALQFLVPVLARGCQSADVVDSLTGLAIGLAAGGLVRVVRRAWPRSHASDQHKP